MNKFSHNLRIRIGDFFEASANGPIAIGALVVALFGYLGGVALGVW